MTIKVWDTNLGLNKRTLGPIDTILGLTTLSNGNLVCAELNHVMSIWTIDSFKLNFFLDSFFIFSLKLPPNFKIFDFLKISLKCFLMNMHEFFLPFHISIYNINKQASICPKR